MTNKAILFLRDRCRQACDTERKFRELDGVFSHMCHLPRSARLPRAAGSWPSSWEGFTPHKPIAVRTEAWSLGCSERRRTWGFIRVCKTFQKKSAFCKISTIPLQIIHHPYYKDVRACHIQYVDEKFCGVFARLTMTTECSLSFLLCPQRLSSNCSPKSS